MLHRWLVCILVVVSAGCTTLEAGPGWRRGTVVQVGNADSLGAPSDGDCRQRDDADRSPDTRYVEVQFFSGRHAHLRIVPIATDTSVVVGDTIYFRSTGCAPAERR